MDGQLGQVLDRLEQHGAHDNTLTMFYSEQGISGPSAKWTLYDAGVRTSFVARWRGRIPAGERERGETDAAARRLYERYQHRPEFELFDLEADPHELNNLAEAPEHRGRLEALHAQLQAWMEDQGDLGPQTEVEARQHQSR